MRGTSPVSNFRIHFKFGYYHRNGRLSWHAERIPEDEIWIKIGGDKGGGTFKMCIQIVNVEGVW